MALVLKDRVKEATITTGTGTITLAGASTGYQSFSVIGNANTTYYCIAGQGTTEWEVGIGTYTASGTTLSRDTILASSNSGSAVNFSAGTKDVFVVYPAGKSVNLDASGNATALGTPASCTVTNFTGTASININGTVGATTPNTGAFTTLTTSSTVTLNGGTANGVLYLNGSKVATSGSALTFDGTNLGIGTSSPGVALDISSGTPQIKLVGTGTTSEVRINSSFGNANLGAIGTVGASPFMLYTSNTERMRIDSSGNVGIGTSSPSTWTGSKLVILTASSTASQIAIENTSYAVGQTMGIDFTVGGGSKQAFLRAIVENGTTAATGLSLGTASAGNNATERMRIDASGNVGIGASSITNWGGYRTLQIGTSDSVLGHLALYNSTGRAAFVAGNTASAAFGSGINIPVVFEVNSSERMRIDSSGNVGIGTSSPGARLDVQGAGGSVALRIKRDASNVLDFYQGGGVSWIDASAAGSQINLAIAGSAKATLDSSGNVGIGVTPSAWDTYKVLEAGFAGSAFVSNGGSSQVGIVRNGYWASGGWKYAGTGTATLQLQQNGEHQFWNAGSGTAGNAITFTQAMTLNSSGVLLVGATASVGSYPKAEFHNSGTTCEIGVYGNNYGGVIAKDQYSGKGTACYYGFAQSANIGFGQIGTTSNHDFTFITNGTERARITSAGNVGIGTSSPAQKLNVVTSSGNCYIRADRNSQSTGQVGYQIGGGTSSTDWFMYMPASSNDLAFFGNSAERMRIDSSGNLLIGTTTVGSKLTVADNISLQGAGNTIYAESFPTTASAANVYIGASNSYMYRSTSALKYKQDIRDLEEIDINKFRPIRYKSKCQGDDQTKDHFGIIADEVADAGIEELVTRGENGEVEGFQYERLTVVLLKEIQCLRQRIAALEAK